MSDADALEGIRTVEQSSTAAETAAVSGELLSAIISLRGVGARAGSEFGAFCRSIDQPAARSG
jgi:hypothetical protein